MASRSDEGSSPPQVLVSNIDAFDKLPEDPTVDEYKAAIAQVNLAELEERVDEVKDSWETDSLYDDLIIEVGADAIADDDDDDYCKPQEADRLRRELHALGPSVFCERTVDSGRYTIKKLLTAFNIRAPSFIEDLPDPTGAYVNLLSVAIKRELDRRSKLARWNSVDDAVHLIDRSKNIIVITGAGISTSLGIPDFRSKGTGLYSKLEHLGLGDPQEVFDISVFKEDPTIFYSVAKDIIPATDKYTPTHRFIAMLHERGKLLTNYSQNIDNLEVKAGVPKDKLIQCHGSFGTASCVKCGYQVDGESIFPDIRAGKIPKCERCLRQLRPGGQVKRKRSSNAVDRSRRRRKASDDDDDDDDDEDGAYDIPTAGVMKPDITFFGEALPDEFGHRLAEHDRELVDLVIVIGTSLKVTPVSEISNWLPAHVPQIYVSRQAVSHINFDIDLLGDCDVVASELCRRLGWELKHEMVPRGEVVDVEKVEGYPSRHTFEARKD